MAFTSGTSSPSFGSSSSSTCPRFQFRRNALAGIGLNVQATLIMANNIQLKLSLTYNIV